MDPQREPSPGGASDPGETAPIPSPLQAVLVWLTAAVAILGAGLAVAAAAAASAAAAGRDPARVLDDPRTSPLVNSATWIAVGTVANELAVLATLAVWLWRLRTPWRVVLPLGRPSLLGVTGSVLLVFGLAPFAEVMGELTHRLLGHELTASRLVVNAARGASGSGLVLLLFALGVLPAVAEEALFRGLVTAPFERRFAVGLVVPSVLFGLFHLEPTQVAGTIVLGLGFAAARLCTGTLVAPAVAHLVYNSTVVLTVRFSDALVERKLDVVPVAVGLLVASGGSLLLWRERRALVARRGGGRESLPSWWV